MKYLSCHWHCFVYCHVRPSCHVYFQSGNLSSWVVWMSLVLLLPILCMRLASVAWQPFILGGMDVTGIVPSCHVYVSWLVLPGNLSSWEVHRSLALFCLLSCSSSLSSVCRSGWCCLATCGLWGKTIVRCTYKASFLLCRNSTNAAR